jgi:predicted  nucleic acid-binding Zn-ribbon protein
MVMNQKTNTYLLTGILIVLAIGLILAIGYNSRNKKNLKAEKITSGTLLTEKEKAITELDKLNGKYTALNTKSEENLRMLAECRNSIAGLEKKVSSLSGENRALRKSSAELAELKKKYEALEKESAQLKVDHEQLLAKNARLQGDLAALGNEKSLISDELNRARLYDADNFLVTATRGKKVEKTVICASRTKKLNMAFEIPQELTEAISFRITTPAGVIINPDDSGIAWFFPPEAGSYVATLSSVSGEFEKSRQVVLNYAATERLAKGDYKIEILSNGQNIGNCRIRLK